MSIPLALSPVGYDTWVTELRRALITYLGSFDLIVDYLPNQKKLVVHTNQITEELYNGIPAIVDAYIPAGVVSVQYNHSLDIPWQDWTAGYTQLDFLENELGTGMWTTPYMNLGFKLSNEHTVTCTYTPLSRKWINTYYGAGGFWASYDYNGHWGMCANLGIDKKHLMLQISYPQTKLGKKYTSYASATRFAVSDIGEISISDVGEFITGGNCTLFMTIVAGDIRLNCGKVRIYSFHAEKNSIPERNLIPTLDINGVACMYDTVTKRSFYNADEGTVANFIAGIETLAQLQNMARNLPSGGGALIISMPDTFETDTAAQAAIAAIEAKGWVLTKNYRTDETT